MKKLVVGFIIVLILIYCYGNFFTEKMLYGTYVNTNYSNPVADVPSGPDTLKLFDNYQFTSHEYGEGTYKLSRNVSGARIILMYHDKYGTGTITIPATRNYYIGNIKLCLNSDTDQHYRKID